jgi:hypothetical protein
MAASKELAVLRISRPIAALFLPALSIVALPNAAAAEFPTFHGSWENDTRTISRGAMPSDRFYTNGVRASLTWAPSTDATDPHGVASAVIRRMPFVRDTMFSDQFARSFGYAIGQNMYSPSRIDQAVPDPADRPYGGWLYVGVIGTHVEYQPGGDKRRGVFRRPFAKVVQTVELDAGAIGPASGAAETQKWVHANLCDCIEPKGWGSQIKDEPGVHASYDWAWRRWQAYRIGKGKRGLYERERLADFSTSLGVSAGNVFTNGRAGGVLRAGWNLSDDLAPDANIRSFGAGDPWVPPPVAAYAYARGEARAVVRNVFLDGNLLRTSRRVDSRPVVADWEYGVAVDVLDLRASWRRVMRSPEFVGQDSPQVYGVINVALNPVATFRRVWPKKQDSR